MTRRAVRTARARVGGVIRSVLGRGFVRLPMLNKGAVAHARRRERGLETRTLGVGIAAVLGRLRYVYRSRLAEQMGLRTSLIRLRGQVLRVAKTKSAHARRRDAIFAWERRNVATCR